MTMTETTAAPLSFAGTAWRLDPGFSAAEFRVGTLWGLTTVHGRFTRLDGGIDPAGRMWLVIDAASLDTGNPRRDRHLRSADFFDCERHPQIEFRSHEGSADATGDVPVSGELQVAGRRIGLELEPTVQLRGERLAIELTTTIDQRRLGMTYRRLGIRVGATVTVRALLAPETHAPGRP